MQIWSISLRIFVKYLYIRLKFAEKWPQFINFSLRFPKSDRLLAFRFGRSRGFKPHRRYKYNLISRDFNRLWDEQRTVLLPTRSFTLAIARGA